MRSRPSIAIEVAIRPPEAKEMSCSSGGGERRTSRSATRARAITATLALAVGCGCATAHNYLDPEGPRFEGGRGAPSGSDPAIRVVTFNIKYAEHIDRAIEALRLPPLRGADVLVLQEMDAPGVEAVAQALAMHYVYYPASVPPSSGRDFGNAVLSPWPIEESRKILLPHKSRIIHQARAAVAATVRVAGRHILVYSVHLTSPLGTSASKRREQADAIIADARTCPNPVIIAGDFNSKGLGTRFEAAGFAWLTKGVGRTAGLFSFDHIFVRGLALADETRAGVAREGPKASDHRPVWAELVPS